MTLKSALEDLSKTTLAAVAGLLGKLRYLASLRRGSENYRHWGMARVHGDEASDRAFRSAHGAVLRGVLRAPMATLMDDLRDSSAAAGKGEIAYLEEVQREELCPPRSDPASSTHLNAVMVALSSLVRVQSPSNRSSALPRRPPALKPLPPEDGEVHVHAQARGDEAGG
jgi:hypothetical protein